VRARLFLALAAVVVLSVLLSRGSRRGGNFLTRKRQRLRGAFFAAAVICVVIDAMAIASGGVTGVGDVLQLLATTVLPFTYLYWRFGGSFKPGRE
jgi:hypothetical protein